MKSKIIMVVVAVLFFLAAMTVYQVAKGAGTTEEWRVPSPPEPSRLKTATQPAAPPGEAP